MSGNNPAVAERYAFLFPGESGRYRDIEDAVSIQLSHLRIFRIRTILLTVDRTKESISRATKDASQCDCNIAFVLIERNNKGVPYFGVAENATLQAINGSESKNKHLFYLDFKADPGMALLTNKLLDAAQGNSRFQGHAYAITSEDQLLGRLNGVLTNDLWKGADIPDEILPPPGAGPHFGLGLTGQIASIPTDGPDPVGNDRRRIDQLLPLVRECVEDFLARAATLANQHPLLVRDASRYRQLVSVPLPEIQWGILWGIGVRLETATAAAERRVADRMAPELEDEPLAALQSLRNLHAPLILATAEGKELQGLADRQLMTREQQSALRHNADLFAAALNTEGDVIEPAAAAVAQEAIETIGAEPHPERGTTYGTATIKNLSLVFVAAAVAATPGFGSPNMAGVAASMGIWEVLKKWPTFAKAAEQLGRDIDANLVQDAALLRNVAERLTPFRSFILRQEQPLRAIAAATPQLMWLTPYIDWIVRTSRSEPGSGMPGGLPLGSGPLGG